MPFEAGETVIIYGFCKAFAVMRSRISLIGELPCINHGLVKIAYGWPRNCSD